MHFSENSITVSNKLMSIEIQNNEENEQRSVHLVYVSGLTIFNQSCKFFFFDYTNGHYRFYRLLYCLLLII